jgi:molybdopterin biosynthesis enzyme MoaB
VGDALLINLAGSPGAVRDGIPVVLDVAEHALSQLDGRDHG